LGTRESLAARLAALRGIMKEKGLFLLVVPSSDPHSSEYVPACWRRREAISGFAGSAGTALVAADAAWLWVDSRYWLEAGRATDPSLWTIVRQGAPGIPDFADELARLAGKGGAVGVDPGTITVEQEIAWKRALDRKGGRLVPVEANLVDEVWGGGRPERPAAPVEIQPLRFSGEAPASKLARIREAMAKAGARAHVVTMLDAIAWTFDLRGADVDFNPVFVGFAIVEATRARLFVDAAKLSGEVRGALPGDVEIAPYEGFSDALASLGSGEEPVWIDPATASAAVKGSLLAAGARLHEAPSPISAMKAAKNVVELDGARAAHLRDGVALVRFLAWLEREAPSGKVTEISAAEKAASLRGEGEHFRGLSFETISAFADHGAIVHYRPAEEGTRVVDGSSLFLFDSGAQYRDGTTDVTRTVMLGTPTDEQKDRFTRVLRGHIALARTVFPAGTTGRQIDVLARTPLWDAGLNYGHGTGHGVGSYLGVHEGPQRISPLGSDVPLEPGMIVSNEPGFYAEGSYGIRIENLVAVVPRPDLSGNGARFLGFETLTLCPIDRKLVDAGQLSPSERTWLDAYHLRVREALSPHLDPADREWLERATEPV
jgi:Xaa-Pro aminopeptidase